MFGVMVAQSALRLGIPGLRFLAATSPQKCSIERFGDWINAKAVPVSTSNLKGYSKLYCLTQLAATLTQNLFLCLKTTDNYF